MEDRQQCQRGWLRASCSCICMMYSEAGLQLAWQCEGHIQAGILPTLLSPPLYCEIGIPKFLSNLRKRQ